MGHIVDDADREAVKGFSLLKVREDSPDLGRRRVLGGEAVAAADHGEVRPAAERGADVEVERVAGGAHLLGAVEDRDGSDSRRQSRDKPLHIERPVEVDLNEADLLAARVQVIDGLLDAARDGAHRDDDSLGVRGTVIVENVVVAAGDLIYFLHVTFHDVRKGLVIAVVGLADLEENVRILDRRVDHRVLRVERVRAELRERLPVDELLQVLVVHALDLVDLMGSPESVKEMKERHHAPDRGEVGDARQVHDLLDIPAREQGKAGRAAVVDIGVVAENREGMGAHRAARDVEDRRKALARDAVHGRDHQHEALGRGEAGGQSARLGSPVDRRDRA